MQCISAVSIQPLSRVVPHLQEGDLVITLGAGQCDTAVRRDPGSDKRSKHGGKGDRINYPDSHQYNDGNADKKKTGQQQGSRVIVKRRRPAASKRKVSAGSGR